MGVNQGSFTNLGGSMQMVILMDFPCIVWVGNIMTPVEPIILYYHYVIICFEVSKSTTKRTPLANRTKRISCE